MDNATLNSTTVIPTTSSISVKQPMPSSTVAAVGFIVLGIGCCANAVVLAVLLRARREFDSSVHTLITNQSIIDLFTCVAGMVTLIVMVSHGYRYNGNAIIDGAICVTVDT